MPQRTIGSLGLASLVVLALIAGSGWSQSPTKERKVLTPKQIRDLAQPELAEVFNDAPKFVPGFYQEDIPVKERSETIVMWVSERALGSGRPQTRANESLKKAKVDAQDFLDGSNLSALAKSIVKSQETKRYFQFTTEELRNANEYNRWVRVWNQSYFKPVTLVPDVTVTGRPIALGTIGKDYFNDKGVSDLAQFCWWCQYASNDGAKVIGEVEIVKNEEKITATVPFLQAFDGGGQGRVRVYLNLWILEVYQEDRLAWVHMKTLQAGEGFVK